jgi:hypothetical protein
VSTLVDQQQLHYQLLVAKATVGDGVETLTFTINSTFISGAEAPVVAVVAQLC